MGIVKYGLLHSVELRVSLTILVDDDGRRQVGRNHFFLFKDFIHGIAGAYGEGNWTASQDVSRVLEFRMSPLLRSRSRFVHVSVASFAYVH